MSKDDNKRYYHNLATIYDVSGQSIIIVGIVSTIVHFNDQSRFGDTKVYIQLIDNRIQKNSKIIYYLEHKDLYSLCFDMEKVTKDVYSFKNAFSENRKLKSVSQFRNKCVKTLQIDFKNNNSNTLITIEDKSSNSIQTTVEINSMGLFQFYSILKEIKDNFVDYTINIRNLDLTNINSELISSLNSRIDDLKYSIDKIKYNNSKETVDDEVFDIDENDYFDESECDSSEFTEKFKQNLDIDGDLSEITKEFISEENVKQHTVKNSSNVEFINTFLNGDICSIDRYRDIFTLCNENSDKNIFSPHAEILKLSGVDSDIIKRFESFDNYFECQLYMISLLKKNTVLYTKYGNINVNRILYYDSLDSLDLYDIAKCSFICMVIYNHVYSLLSKVNGTNVNIDSLKLSIEFIKIVLGPFILQVIDRVEVDGIDKVKDDLVDTFLLFDKSGAFDKIKDKYSSMTMNGVYNIDVNSFSSRCVAILEKSGKLNRISNIDILRELDSIEVTINEKLKSCDDVCRLLFNDSNREKTDYEKLDPSVKNFLKLTKDIIEEKLYSDIVKIGSSYGDFSDLIDSSCINEEINNIKKAFDINRNISNKKELNSELYNIAKEKEDSDNESDWNKILFGSN